MERDFKYTQSLESFLVDSTDEVFKNICEAENMTVLLNVKQTLYMIYARMVSVKDDVINGINSGEIEPVEGETCVKEFHHLLLVVEKRYKYVEKLIDQRMKEVEEKASFLILERNLKVWSDETFDK